jgi:biotin carboxyl carrier protein
MDAKRVRAFYRELKGLGFVEKTVQPAATNDHREDIATFMGQANDYLASGRYELARGLYEAALELDPDNQAAQMGLDLCRGTSQGTTPGIEVPPPGKRRTALWTAAMSLALSAAGVVAYLLHTGELGSAPEIAEAKAPDRTSEAAVVPSIGAKPTDSPGQGADAVMEFGAADANTAPGPPKTTHEAHPDAAAASSSDAGATDPQEVRVEVTERSSPGSHDVVAPQGGWVTEFHVPSGAQASSDQPIATVTTTRGNTRQIDQLRARVVELKRLAKQSAAYEEFLETTRARLRRLRRPADEIDVKAGFEGVVRHRAEERESVDKGEVLAVVEDPALTVRGSLEAAEIQPLKAQCAVRDPDGTERPCNVTRVEASPQHTVVVAKVSQPPENWKDESVSLSLSLTQH